MPNQNFSHLKNYKIEEHNPLYGKFLCVLKELQKEDKLISWHKDIEGRQYPVHICYPEIDFSTWMHLSEPEVLMKYTYIRSHETANLQDPSSFFRKKRKEPVSKAEWCCNSELNTKKRGPFVGTSIEDNTEIVVASRSKFKSPKKKFNGEDIFPAPSRVVSVLPI